MGSWLFSLCINLSLWLLKITPCGDLTLEKRRFCVVKCSITPFLCQSHKSAMLLFPHLKTLIRWKFQLDGRGLSRSNLCVYILHTQQYPLYFLYSLHSGPQIDLSLPKKWRQWHNENGAQPPINAWRLHMCASVSWSLVNWPCLSSRYSYSAP